MSDRKPKYIQLELGSMREALSLEFAARVTARNHPNIAPMLDGIANELQERIESARKLAKQIKSASRPVARRVAKASKTADAG